MDLTSYPFFFPCTYNTPMEKPQPAKELKAIFRIG